jgi:hypothetical protein
MTDSELSQLRSQLHDLAARVARIETVVGLDEVPAEALTNIKALIKNGSNAWFNGVRENPHAHGSREHELWQYGADLARDVAENR